MSTVPENAPESCPGTNSNEAGKALGCAGCPNQNICSSGKPKGPDPDIGKIQDNLSKVKHIILTLSGKGGVGKSTVSSILSHCLAMDQEKIVGLLDIDICGPSIPHVMGVSKEQVHQSGSGWDPIYVEDNLAVMSTGFLLPNDDDAVIWRGDKKNGLIKQFLRDVYWDNLDYLIVDTPPGTTDEHISIVQLLKKCNLAGAIIVTTPQEVALQDVRKEISFCRKVKLPILGVVENMSGFVCPNCKTESLLFPPTTGGAEALCKELNLKLLGKIPVDQRISKSCDEGKFNLEEFKDFKAGEEYLSIVQKLKTHLELDNELKG